ncbi:unnamed protein product [Soboliphyme baturini]|uniref:MSP domain-containing protein n=1 Tax=Soboliphyme baturini TaxID=241478 RepID=A0A183J440_9BILA|nr:unnamed protein product [Soboliphyme baturini]
MYNDDALFVIATSCLIEVTVIRSDRSPFNWAALVTTVAQDNLSECGVMQPTEKAAQMFTVKRVHGAPDADASFIQWRGDVPTDATQRRTNVRTQTVSLNVK